MGEVKGAARKDDLIEHGTQRGAALGKIASAIFDWGVAAYKVYKVAKVAAAGAAAATGVGAIPAAIGLGASFVVEWAASYAIEKTVAYVVARNKSGIHGIEKGSPNIFVNKRDAARGGKEGDPLICHKGKKIRQGSQWVSFNKKPAARLEDITDCPGNIATASTNVAIGGPPVEFDPHATLSKVLFALTLYNAAKKGLVTGVVENSSVLKSVGKELRDAVRDKLITDQMSNGADKGLEALPW